MKDPSKADETPESKAARAASEIKADERVVLFPSLGVPCEDGRAWRVAVHGWIFEPEEESWRRNLALSATREALDLEEGALATEHFNDRVRRFLVDNERGKRVAVSPWAGEVLACETSDPDGHFFGAKILPADACARAAKDGCLPIRAVTRENDNREFVGRVHLVPAEGLSVLSDIDDTIKISEVLDKKKLVRNTFYEPFRAVEGMTQVYRDWEQAGVRFHFASGSPWQLYEPLSTFFREAGFPEASWHIKRFRIKDSSFLNLFMDPFEFKVAEIDPLLKAFPRRRFVMVGDSGEQDPEVYGEMARRFPKQVARIYIRDVTGQKPEDPRYRAAFEGLPAGLWEIFADPKQLRLP